MKEHEFLELAYAAYGSNLHLKQMEVRCPTAECIGNGYLEDYQLVFGKRGFLDVVPCPGQKVQVGLFKVTDTDLQALDEYEEYPELYDRITVSIQTESKEKIQAFVYKMNPYDTMEKPTDAYWTTINEGYDNFSFDKKDLEEALSKIDEEVK